MYAIGSLEGASTASFGRHDIVALHDLDAEDAPIFGHRAVLAWHQAGQWLFLLADSW
jgi:hypothetical protein